MRKGLTTTLMAVAVAILAMQAMAMAPVITDIPSPVVGNAENATPSQGFVYPDAIDLTKYVTDQESQSSQIIWSYDTVGTPKYKINFVGPIDIGGGEDPVAPGAKALNNPVGGGEANPDGNPLTITVRNINLSPIPGVDNTQTGGILPGESQLITFYASDQTTFTASKPVWFYTNAGGPDYLSPGRTTCWWYPNQNPTTSGWRYSPIAGTVTSSFDANNHFCMTTTASATQDKAGEWKSPYGDFNAASLPLFKNAAYRIRVIITSSQTNVDAVPLFDIYVANLEIWSTTPSFVYNGQNAYGANFFVYSNVGGANGAVSSTGKEFNFWWTPSCVDSARWNSESETSPGLWAPSMVNHRSGFVVFRILQSPSNTALVSQANAFGTLCLKDFLVERADFSSMQVLSTSWQATSMTTSLFQDQSKPGVAANATLNFSGGIVTVTPNNGTSDMLAQVIPGDAVTDFNNQSATVDDYPCVMEQQSLYLVTADMSAPTQTAADNPPQIMWLGADCYTNELCQLSWVSLKANHCAMPSTTQTPYKAFFHSNYGTLHGGVAQYAWFSIFRPRFMVGNNAATDTDQAKTGGIRIHNMKVEKVMFP